MNQTELTRLGHNLPVQEASFILGDPFSALDKGNHTDNAGFDLKFDALKSYLDGFKAVINQHATIINQLTSNMQQGKTEIAHNSTLDEKTTLKMLEERIANQLKQISGKSNVDAEKSIEELEKRLKKCEEQVDQKILGIKKNIKEVESHVLRKLEPKLDDFKKDLLAKLDTIGKSGNTTNVEKQIKNLTMEMESLAMGVMSLAPPPATLNRAASGMFNRGSSIGPGDVYRSSSTGVGDIYRSSSIGPGDIYRSLSVGTGNIFRSSSIGPGDGEDIASIRQELAGLPSHIQTMAAESENLITRAISMGSDAPAFSRGSSGIYRTSTGGIKPEDLEDLSSQYRREMNILKTSMKKLEGEMQKKVNLDQLNDELSKKIDISELDKFKAKAEVQINKIEEPQMKKIEESQMNKIEELIDKKLAKIKKELDLTSLLKQIKTKAEHENVVEGFESSDMKISALAEEMVSFKRELEKAIRSFEKSSVNAFSDSASLVTKKLTPLMCLSCGNIKKSPPTMMMGKDGKLYRSEIQQNPQESVDREYFPDLRGPNKPTIFTKDDKTVKVGFNFAPSPIQSKPRPSSSLARKVIKPLNDSNPTFQISIRSPTTHKPELLNK